MNINIKTNKNFTTHLNKMKEKYGEEFEKLNGLHDKNLSYGDFIDGFIDEETVADATIDGNANAGSKDICSLEAEMDKPASKLLAFNKIFYEMNKKYGLQSARDWLETEWNGGFYLHDAPSSTFKPYSYFGKETLMIKYKDEQKFINFENLYSLLNEEEVYDSQYDFYAKYPQTLFVRDVIDNKQIWTKVTRVLKHNNEKEMRFIKYSNGLSQIVTEDHPIITTTGDILAKDLKTSHQVVSKKYNNKKIKQIDTVLDVNLDFDFGYIAGMFLAEGVSNINSFCICQKKDTDSYNIIVSMLENLNIPHSIRETSPNRIFIKSSKFQKALQKICLGTTCEHKQLNEDFIYYPKEFLNGVISGIFDGDGNLEGYKNRRGIIRLTSRTLLNQITTILQKENIFARSRTPYLPNSKQSFESKLTMYGIGFSIGDNENYFINELHSYKIKNDYTLRERKGNFKNKDFDDNYDEIKVIKNEVFIEDVNVVYDITTETGHFICNNIVSHNCFAYDLDQLAEKGLFFIQNNFNFQPPKHLTVYTDFVGEFVSWASNRTSGKIACRFNSFPVIAGVAHRG